jgi:hypothetical protein
MRIFSFTGLDKNNLAKEVSKPVEAIILLYGVVNNPFKIILQRAEEDFLSFASDMADIDERKQVGFLNISKDDKGILESKYNDVMIYKFMDKFIVKQVKLLKIVTKEFTSYSGISLVSSKGIIEIISADYPYTLYTTGPHIRGSPHAPEYSRDDYSYEDVLDL